MEMHQVAPLYYEHAHSEHKTWAVIFIFLLKSVANFLKKIKFLIGMENDIKIFS